MDKIDTPTLSLLTRIQEIVAKAHSLEPFDKDHINNVCGVDVSYRSEKAAASAVVWSCFDRKVVEVSNYIDEPFFPYRSGYFFIREAPLVISAVKALEVEPDIVLVDGHGIAHPRRAGLAVFVGIALDMPTLGFAKSILVGKIGSFKGITAPILLEGSTVGVALRVRENGKTYFVSPGHKLTVEESAIIAQSEYKNLIKALELAHNSSKKILGEGK
ncbi:MAG: endonuclease V [Candidatus Methylarchaceae archaeon HK02M2]|nr:endonuclease V [Candidatus Methylarchaceae archaeon HK02M2]